MSRRTTTLCTLILCSQILLNPAQAHNVVAGAYVDGMLVEGEIGFSNGEFALPGVKIQVTDGAGNVLGETQTETDGLFSFEASQSIEHIFKADLGAGHVAEIIVAADEFSSVSTSATAPDDKTDKVTQQATSNTNDTVNTTNTNISTGVSAAELESMVRKAVAQQVKPLQKELRAYKEKVMFRDITGGLGFIFGMFGVAAWVASRKVKPDIQSQQQQE